MPDEVKKPRKLSRKQAGIMAFMELTPFPATPSEIGMSQGRVKGSDAADWAFPAIQSLVRVGLVKKVSPGRYLINKEKS
jgi:hypothetical protein